MTSPLRTRPLVLLAVGFLLSAVLSLLVAGAWQRATDRESSHRAVVDFAALHKERVLGVVAHDLALALKLANTTSVRKWIQDPGPATFPPALDELRNVVLLTSTGSAYVSSRRNQTFHYVDRAGIEALRASGATTLPVTQHISRDDPDSAWFYETLAHPGDHFLNIDFNTRLGVTMLWINVVMSDNSGAIGVVGTSVDISDFSGTSGDLRNKGIEAFYVTPDGEIVGAGRSREAPEDTRLPTVWSHLTDASGATAMRAAMARLQADGAPEPIDVEWDGKTRVAGVAYLPQMGWYMVSLHPAPAPGLSAFLVAGLVAAILAGGLLSAWFLDRSLLRPLGELGSRTATLAAQEGDAGMLPLDRDDALGDLARAIASLARRPGASVSGGTLPELTRALVRLQQAENPPALAQTLFSILGPHLAIGQASLYRVAPDGLSLYLCGGYGRRDGDSPPALVEWGQGLLGQCAVERRPLRLPPPPDYLRIGSGLGASAPASLEIRPVLDGDRVLAVVELATLEPLDEARLALLDGLWPALGMCLLALERSERLQQLISDACNGTDVSAAPRNADQPRG